MVRSLGLLSLALFILVAFQNCSGFQTISDYFTSPFSDSSINPSALCTSSPIQKTKIRRLNKEEINNSINDLFGISGNHVNLLPADEVSPDGFMNNATFLKFDSDYYSQLSSLIETAVNKAMTSSTAFQCSGAQDLNCARRLLYSFARKAFRKKIDAAELESLANRVKIEMDAGVPFKEALGVSYQRILMSPFFLLITAGVGRPMGGSVILSPHEIATRLSYFVWAGPPDEILLDLADSNKLANYDVLKGEIRRMLKHNKAKRFIKNFVGQWAGIRSLESESQVIRNDLTPELRADMMKETYLFAESIIQGDRTAMDFVDANYTFVNARLAELYGIPNVTGDNFRQVPLTGSGRKGLITQASVLTLLADSDKTRPTARGKYVTMNFTCTPPPPFPPGQGVTPFSETDIPVNATARERIILHSKSPECASCHTEMDPVGLGLDGFDFLGRKRTLYSENNQPIDTSGTLRKTPFSTADQMIDIIAKQNDYKSCLTKKLVTYAIARTLNTEDQCALRAIGQATVQRQKTFSDLITAIVVSDFFQLNQL